MNSTVVDLEVDARLDEGPHVGAVEGVEVAGVYLDSPGQHRSLHLNFLSFPIFKGVVKINLDEMKQRVSIYHQYLFK